MNEKINKKLPYSKGKSVAFTTICVILTCLLCAILLGCLAAHRLVYKDDTGNAFSSVRMEEITLSDGTSLVTKINRDYIGEGVISEDKLKKILRDGSFDTWVGEKVSGYIQYIALHDHPDQFFPEILTPEIEALINANDSTIRLYTGKHDFAANNPQILRNIKPDLESWNHSMRAALSTDLSAKLLFAAVSEWIWYVLGVLLLLLLIWMTVICVRSQERVGTAFKRYAVTCFVPGALLLLWGLLGSLIVRLAGYGFLQATVKALHGTPVMVGGLACLACTALFIMGILWNTVAGVLEARPQRVRQISAPKPIPAPAPAVTVPPQPAVNAPDPVTASAAPVTRNFCRFCGGELINSDAKFCYKCGKAQE